MKIKEQKKLFQQAREIEIANEKECLMVQWFLHQLITFQHITSRAREWS